MSAGTEGSRDQLREKFWIGLVIQLGGADVIAAALRAGDPGSNPG